AVRRPGPRLRERLRRTARGRAALSSDPPRLRRAWILGGAYAIAPRGMNEAAARPTRLDPPVDPDRDHSLGSPDAEMVLVEYGSYACEYCHEAHEVVRTLRDRFGDRMLYVFRHRPLSQNEEARRAAVLTEVAAKTTGEFWKA